MSIADLSGAVATVESWLRTGPRRYGFAILTIAVATALRYLLGLYLGFQSPFFLYPPTIIAIAWLAGFRPAFVATLIAGTAGGYFFMEPRNTFAVRTPADILGPLMFTLFGIATCMFVEVFRRHAKRLEEFERAMEGLDEMIAVVDRQYRYLIANPAFLKYRGAKKEDVIGRRIKDVLHPGVFDSVVKQKLDECFTGKIVTFELSYSYAVHGERDMIITYYPIQGPNGVERVVCVLQDVTDRKRAEAALRASEQRYHSLFEKSVAGVGILRWDGTIVDCNDAWARIYGYGHAEEMIGAQINAHYPHPAARRMFLNVLQEHGLILNHELEMRRRDGTPVWVLITSVLIENGSGERQIQSTIVDINEKRRAEEELRRREEDYRRFVAQSSEGIFREEFSEPVPLDLPVDELLGRIWRDGHVAECNDALARMYGFESAQALIGKGLGDRMVPDDPRNLELLREYVRSGFRVLERESHETDLQGNPKVFRNSLIGIVEDGKLVRTWGIQRDVTEWVKLGEQRKKAEEALRKSEAHFRFLVEQASDGIAIADWNDRWIDVNSAWVAMMGFTREEILQQKVGANVVEEDKPLVASVLAGLATGQITTAEWRVRRQDGSVFPVEGSAKRLPDGRLQVMARDVTERRLAQEAVERSERQLRSIVNAIPAEIWSGPADGTNDFFNERWRSNMGWNPQDLQGDGWHKMLHPDDRQRILQAWQEAVVNGTPYEQESRHRGADGKYRWVLNRAVPLRDDNGQVIRWYGVQTDIDNLKQAEALVSLRNETLETIANGRPLEETLTTLVRLIERQCPDTMGSVLLLEDDGLHVRHGAGPSLPEAYCKAIDGAAIGPKAGSCGTAMYRKEMVVVSDIAQDPLWKDYRDLAMPHGLRACWSTPIVSHAGKVLGSFAMYYSTPRSPGAEEMRLIEVATHVASIAIERKRAEENLRQSEERFRVALKDSPITVFNHDRELRYTWIYNPCLRTAEELIGRTDDEVIGPEAARPLSELKRRVLETGVALRTDTVISVDGKRRAYDVALEPLLDAEGNIVGITGAYIDIARLRELADNLRDAKDRLAQEKSYLESEIQTELGFEEIVWQSAALREVLKKARIVAPTDSTVLLLGETGTGKELIARSVHTLSARRDKTFVKLNCAAVPAGLLESELFGHEKGAFTSAVSQKIGRIELADKGTLFLDEIGELPLELQPKLLRVLQDREFERLGGVRTIQVDVRIISATNRDLRQDIADKVFREDLYYRLNVFPIELPPLRERREDIPMLVHYFVEKCSARMGKSIDTIPEETLERLRNWSWPGNIRELENMIERMVILTKGRVLAPPPVELEAPQIVGGDGLEEMEREHIIRVLQETNGVLSGADGAAQRLGLKRTTLQSMLKRFGIDAQDFRRATGTNGKA